MFRHSINNNGTEKAIMQRSDLDDFCFGGRNQPTAIFRFSLLNDLRTKRSSGIGRYILVSGRGIYLTLSLWLSNDTLRALEGGHGPDSPPELVSHYHWLL